MVLHLVAVALLAASPAPKLKLAQGKVSFVDVSEAKGAFLVSHLDQRLTLDHGLRVVTQDDVAAVLGLERQKALLGCAGESSCTAELAGALGVDGIVIGSLAKLGNSFNVNLKVVRASDGEALSVFSGRAKTEEQLLEVIESAAAQFGRDVVRAFPAKDASSAATASVSADASQPPALWWVPVAAGGVALAGGAGLYVMALDTEARLKRHDASITDVNATVGAGQTQQAAAFALGAVGVAAVVGGVAWRVFGSAPVQPAVVLAPGLGAIGVSGTWP